MNIYNKGENIEHNVTKAEVERRAIQIRGTLEFVGLGSWQSGDIGNIEVGTGTKTLLKATVTQWGMYDVEMPYFYK